MDVDLVSFAVTCYNERETVGEALDSILALDIPDGVSLEVVVVDDASKDGSGQVLQSYSEEHGSVEVIRLDENQGLGNARRRGVREADGKYVAIVDGDVVLPEDWLTTLWPYLNNYAGVGGVALPDGDVVYIGRRFGLEPKVVGHSFGITGSNVLFRRDALEAVGSFDEGKRFGPDVDIVDRLEKAGYRTRLVEDLVVRHRPEQSFSEFVDRLYSKGTGATRVMVDSGRLRGTDAATLMFYGLAATTVFETSMALVLTGYLLVLSCVHLVRKFRVTPMDLPRFLAAVVVYAVPLTAYFLGRAVGTWELLKGRAIGGGIP